MFLFLPPQCLQRAFNKIVDVISQFVQYEARFGIIVSVVCKSRDIHVKLMKEDLKTPVFMA